MTQVTTLREFLDQAKPVIVGWLTERDSLSGGIGSGGGGGGGLSSHALNGVYHTGTLDDSQAPQFLKTDGTRALTGNLSVDAGVTIDGVDISDFYTDYGNHITNSNIHVDHTTVSIIAGDGLTGGGDISASRTLNVGAGAGLGVSADTVYLSTPGTLSVSSSNSATGAHTHAITTSSNPGANASILASSSAGYLQLVRLGAGVTPSYPLHASSSAGAQLRLAYSVSYYTDFTVGSSGDMTIAPSGGDVQVTGQLGIGLTPSYALHVEDTGTQLRLQYDATHYHTTFISSAGDSYTDVSGIMAFRGLGDGFTVYIRGNDNAFLHFMSNYDSGGVAQAGLVFNDYPTGTKWGFWKGTNDNLQIYDYTNTTYILNVASDGSMLWEPASTGVFQIRKGGEQLRLSYDGSNYTQFIVSNTGQLSIDATGDLIRIGADNDLETVNFASHSLGWQITYDGYGDFRHIYADELQVLAFTADIYQSIIGSIIVTPGRGRLSRDFQIPATSGSGTIYFEDMEEEGWIDYALFTAGDTIRLRYIDTSGGGLIVADVWGTVSSPDMLTLGDGEQSWLFTCTDDGGVSGSYIYAGSLALDYGVSGDGTWLATVTDTAGSPYSQVATWTTNPWTPGNWTVHTRIGNLDGIGTLGAEYGIWAGQGTTDNDKQIIMSDNTAEIRNLDLYVTTGGVTKVRASTAGWISAGATAPTAFSSGVGFWAGEDSSLSKLFIGNKTGGKYLEYNGTDLYIYADANNYIRTSSASLLFYAANNQVIALSSPAAGDVLIGRTTTGNANIWWDANGGSSGGGRFNFRSGTGSTQVYIDDDGVMYAGGGKVELSTDGVRLNTPDQAWNDTAAVKFASSVGDYMRIQSYHMSGGLGPLDFKIELKPDGSFPTYTESHLFIYSLGGSTSGGTTFNRLGLSCGRTTDVYQTGTATIELRQVTGTNSIALDADGISLNSNQTDGSVYVGGTYLGVANYMYAQGGITIGRPLAPSYALEIWNSTTRMADFSFSDTTWFRINQNTAKNIYTPRSMSVAGAFSVGSSSFGSTGDIYATADILAAGGLCAGASTGSNPNTGAVLYTEKLWSYKNSTALDVYAAHYFSTNQTVYNGTSRAAGTYTIDTSAYGVPAGAYATIVRGSVYCSSVGGSIYCILRTKGGSNAPITFRAPAAGNYGDFNGIVNGDANGDIELYVTGATHILYLDICGYLY